MRPLLLSLLLFPALALAVPHESEYKKVRPKRVTRLDNCQLNDVEGPVTFKFTRKSNRIYISIPKVYKRQSPAVGALGAKYVACGSSSVDESNNVLFVKTTLTGPASEHDLDVIDFEEAMPGDDKGGNEGSSGNLGSSCQKVVPFPGSFIYKTIGSSHFTDIRRNTIGLILELGANIATPNCIDIIASDGTKVSDMGLYARGAGWFARYYGGIGCGDAINGSALSSRANSAAGNPQVYFRFGSTCYGPIDANRCIGSSQC